jgi:hypothetical protein
VADQREQVTAETRSVWLAAAFKNDPPAALIEDAFAIGGAWLIVRSHRERTANLRHAESPVLGQYGHFASWGALQV